MFIEQLFNVYENIITGGTYAVRFLFTPLDLVDIAPVYLISFGGLIAFLAIAVVKWFLS